MEGLAAHFAAVLHVPVLHHVQLELLLVEVGFEALVALVLLLLVHPFDVDGEVRPRREEAETELAAVRLQHALMDQRVGSNLPLGELFVAHRTGEELWRAVAGQAVLLQQVAGLELSVAQFEAAPELWLLRWSL